LNEVEELIQAISIGWTPEEFYNSTQFWFDIHLIAEQEKIKRHGILNLYTLNTLISQATEGKSEGLNYDDIFGIEQLKDYNLKSRLDFENREDFDKYLVEVVIPLKKELGVI